MYDYALQPVTHGIGELEYIVYAIQPATHGELEYTVYALQPTTNEIGVECKHSNLQLMGQEYTVYALQPATHGAGIQCMHSSYGAGILCSLQLIG